MSKIVKANCDNIAHVTPQKRQTTTKLTSARSDIVIKKGYSPYIGDNGHWYEYDVDVKAFVDTGIIAQGESGAAYITANNAGWGISGDNRNFDRNQLNPNNPVVGGIVYSVVARMYFKITNVNDDTIAVTTIFKDFSGKQDKLTAGDNISIVDNVISAIDGGASSWDDLTDKPFDSIDNDTLIVRDGVLSVNTTDVVEPDNTKPITSSSVHVIVGNIDTLLSLI